MRIETLANEVLPIAELADATGNACPAREATLEEMPAPRETSVLGLVEMLLKEPGRADLLSMMTDGLLDVVPRLLSIALASYATFGLTLALLLNLAPAEAYPHHVFPVPAASWADGSAAGLVFGYTVGLAAATGICLPTFYFFGLLAGVRLSMLQITGLVLRAKAAAAIVLVGILPIYVAVALGLMIFKAPVEILENCFYVGLLLPFMAGLEGMHRIYRGVHTLAQFQTDEWRASRACFLRRLTISWSSCYTAVSPVMVYRLWEMFGPV